MSSPSNTTAPATIGVGTALATTIATREDDTMPDLSKVSLDTPAVDTSPMDDNYEWSRLKSLAASKNWYGKNWTMSMFDQAELHQAEEFEAFMEPVDAFWLYLDSRWFRVTNTQRDWEEADNSSEDVDKQLTKTYEALFGTTTETILDVLDEHSQAGHLAALEEYCRSLPSKPQQEWHSAESYTYIQATCQAEVDKVCEALDELHCYSIQKSKSIKALTCLAEQISIVADTERNRKLFRRGEACNSHWKAMDVNGMPQDVTQQTMSDAGDDDHGELPVPTATDAELV